MTRHIGVTGVALIACTLSPWSSIQAGEVLDRVMSKGVLVMSTDAEYPPQSSLDRTASSWASTSTSAAQIAERLGVDIEFVTPGWEVITAGHWNGRWDVSVGSMTPTEARAEVLDFPAVYYYTPAALACTGQHHDHRRRPRRAASGSGSASRPPTRAISRRTS